MAKIGEADPRWIVDNRGDGKNVNNWHWAELDYETRGSDALKALFKDVPFSAPQVKRFAIDKVDSCKGDMTLANRKGKIIFFYDFNLKFKWSAILLDDATAAGTMELTDITAPDDFDLKITIEGENSSNSILREVIKQSVIPNVKKMLQKWNDEMRESQGPGSNPTSPKPAPASGAASASASASTTNAAVAALPKTNVKSSSFKCRVTLSGPTPMIFESLLDAPRVSAFTQSPAEIQPKVGSQFKLFNGTVTGEILECEPAKKLAQRWRFKDWPENHQSHVSMSFETDGGDCVITLTHSNVPENDLERTRSGWEQFFWQRMRGVFGWQYSVKNL